MERSMTTFDDREKSYEKKFAMDEELKFKSEQRRNKLSGRMGGAAKLGLIGSRGRGLHQGRSQGRPGVQGRRGRVPENPQGFRRQGVAVADAELRKAMDDFLVKAVTRSRQRQRLSGGLVQCNSGIRRSAILGRPGRSCRAPRAAALRAATLPCI